MTAPSWPSETVEACLDRVRLPRVSGVKARDYKPAGRYPIVDQGQALIAGWTDAEDGVISEPLPVVVFGDHSRTFKYIDFPFVRGADGTQILKPRKDVHPLFFYFACRSLDLTSRGYNRHFSLLKEQSIPIPDPQEQARIAGTLQEIDEHIRHQARQLMVTGDLMRTVTHRLFSCGLRGQGQKETELGAVPRGWVSVKIGDLGQVVTGTTPPTKDLANYVPAASPFVAPGDFGHGESIVGTAKQISELGLALSRPIPPGSTCFVCIGSTIGKVGITTASVCATNQQINAVIPSDRFHAKYVFHLLTHWSDHVKRHASSSPVPILSKGAFERITVPASVDHDEQRDIAAILDAVDSKIANHRHRLALLERLFDELLHRLLTGDIRIGELHERSGSGA